jgi:hypothetical protein
MSPVGYVPQETQETYTSAVMNGMVFLNRSDRPPWYVYSLDDRFDYLPSWDPTWTCQSLRSLGPALVAINVTKDGINYPTMVKTSDYCVFGSPPATWVADPSNAATENLLTDLSEPLVDGLNLRGSLVLYSNHETWLMTPSQDSLVYTYTPLFNSYGMINTNCGVAVNNSHFVFGTSDIWSHDGLKYKSIAVSRVRDFIYDHLVQTERHQFFVYHDDHDKEIGFCYVSTDPKVYYPAQVDGAYPGCNRSAVYNYAFDTWTFYDLPYVTHATVGSAKPSPSYDYYLGLQTPYNQMTETYDDLNSDGSLVTLMCNQGSTSAMRSFLRPDYPIDAGIDELSANAPVVCERQFLNVKQAIPETPGYKVVTAIYPEGIFSQMTSSVDFYVGSTDYCGISPPEYQGPWSYTGDTDYKLDFTSHGRFLSVKLEYTGLDNFSLTGYDINLEPLGHR